MIQISFALALIAIVYGAKWLSQSTNLKTIYKCLAWFVIAMGFLILLCDGAQALMRCCHRCQDGRMMQKECMMMNRGGNMDCPMMMNHCNNGNMSCGTDPCCKMMMNHSNCCGGMGNCCDGGMMNCPEGGMNACKAGMPANCPMMKGDKKSVADSGKAK